MFLAVACCTGSQGTDAMECHRFPPQLAVGVVRLRLGGLNQVSPFTRRASYSGSAVAPSAVVQPPSREKLRRAG